jgi:protein TonB
MSQNFALQDNRRFMRILLLAGILHLVLIAVSFHTNSAFSLNQAINALYEISELASANQDHSVSVNIASHNYSTQSSNAEGTAHAKTFPNEPLLKKRTISAASHQQKDAVYLSQWQNTVEQFGNTHYPQEAIQKNICGDLRLLVAINRDGSLHEVCIRQSSGSALLDQSAIDIVKKAAPFAPLPPEIADEVEVLEIIRTWQFRGTVLTTAQS